MSFYITLPSNSRNDAFENTVSHFKTKLAQRIELKGNWEGGLASISYTNSWYNLSTRGELFLRYYKNGPVTAETYGVIYQGRYDTIDDLISMINYRFKKTKDAMKKEDEKDKYFGNDEFSLPELECDKKT